MAEVRKLLWTYNDGYKDAMVVLVGYAVPSDEEPANTPSLEVEYAIPQPAISPPGGASTAASTSTTSKKQTSKLGVKYFGAKPPTPTCVGALYGGFEQVYFIGKVTATVRWQSKAGKDYEATDSFDAKDILNKQTTVTVGQIPAELTETLVSETQSSEEGKATVAYSTSLDESERATLVGDILVHLESKLEQGLGELWKRVDAKGCCYNGHALRDHDFSTGGLEREQLLECWAQHATELLIGGPYAGTATNMGVPGAIGLSGSHAQDAYLAMRCVSGARLLVPLMFQCQQLATMVLICLGLDTIAQDPIDSHDVKNGNLPGKTTLTAKDNVAELNDWLEGGWPSAMKQVDRKLARVGTCYYYEGDGGTPAVDGDDFPHVAATLRVGRTPQRLQLVDTGAWVFDAKGRLKAKTGGGGYMYDTAWVRELKKSDMLILDSATKKVVKTIKFSFQGVMQPPVVPDSDIVKAIERMRGARMLGAVRLVLKERKTGNLWWVSQLLPMERDKKPYSMARLMAALRGCPHRKDVEMKWQVVMGSSASAEQKLWVSDPASLSTCAAKNCLEDEDLWWRDGTLIPIAEISIGADGKPFFSWKGPPFYSNTGFRPKLKDTDDARFGIDGADLQSLRMNSGFAQFVDLSTQQTRVGAWFKGA